MKPICPTCGQTVPGPEEEAERIPMTRNEKLFFLLAIIVTIIFEYLVIRNMGNINW